MAGRLQSALRAAIPTPFARPDVLIVDDDDALREALIEVFRLEGRVALGASNGVEALDLLTTTPLPRVILIDLNMPVMNGWDFVRSLEKLPDLREIPIAVMSGVTTDRLAPARENDAGFFEKPLKLDELLDAIGRHLPQP